MLETPCSSRQGQEAGGYELTIRTRGHVGEAFVIRISRVRSACVLVTFSLNWKYLCGTKTA